jgi:hypothetical protein
VKNQHVEEWCDRLFLEEFEELNNKESASELASKLVYS